MRALYRDRTWNFNQQIAFGIYKCLQLAGILLDTANLRDPRCTSKDKYMASLLINGAGRYGCNGLYQLCMPNTISLYQFSFVAHVYFDISRNNDPAIDHYWDLLNITCMVIYRYNLTSLLENQHLWIWLDPVTDLITYI